MGALLFIAKNNLKKRKGDVVVLLLLTALATLLLYTSISVLSGTDEVIQLAYEQAHTADFFFMTNLGEEEKIARLLQSQPEVESYERSECYYFLDSQYRDDRSAEKISFSFILGIAGDRRTIGRLPKEASSLNENEILLPFYLKSNYGIGDAFYLTVGEKEFAFTVGGYVEDPLFATPMNVSTYTVYLPGARMEQLLEASPKIAESHYLQHKVRLKEGSDCVAFEERMSSLLSKEIPALSYGMNVGINWGTMKNGITLMSGINMGIILIFSILLIVVALLIVRFSMKNFIERNLKNIGMQLAAGYTARQLQLISVLEAAWISLFGIGSGIVLGAASSSLIGQFQGRMLGLSWRQGFHAPAALLSMLLVFVVITLAAGIVGRVFRRMSVLDALRGGIHIHNFRKNYFPFEKSRLPVSLVLAGKNILGEKKKNLSIGCMVSLLVFATCMGFGIYENFAVDTEYLMRLVGIETGDVFVSCPEPTAAAKEMEHWPQVKQILYYNNISVHISNGEKQRTLSCDVWNRPDLLQHEMMLRGRIPQYENEIVLTVGLAEALGVDVGDTVYVEGEGARLDYLVCGVDQKINNLGIKSMMHSLGARRLNQMSEEEELYTVLYLFVHEQVSYEQMEEKIHEAYPEASVSDGQRMTQESLSNVSSSMTAICVIFVLTTLFVVALVELLLIHAKVLREQKNYGISKALGYTTRQLMAQTVMLNLPVILFGTVAGMIFSHFFSNSLAVFFLSTVGIRECNLSFSPLFMLATVVGILTVAAAASLLGAIRIRGIEPVELLHGE